MLVYFLVTGALLIWGVIGYKKNKKELKTLKTEVSTKVDYGLNTLNTLNTGAGYMPSNITSPQNMHRPENIFSTVVKKH